MITGRCSWPWRQGAPLSALMHRTASTSTSLMRLPRENVSSSSAVSRPLSTRYVLPIATAIELLTGAFYCDPAIDRLMNLADTRQATDPARAAATWTAVDRAVTYAAPG